MSSFLESEFQGFVHRGDTSIFLENTIEAFQSAVSLGYQYLETDLRETSDGKIITFHDPNLKRITGANITISETKFSDIRMRRLPSREIIPTIDELLEEFPDSFFNMDLKVNQIEEKVLKKINSHNALERVCLGSFNSKTIKKINSLEPKILTSMGISQVIMYKFFQKKNLSKLIRIPTHWKGIKVITKKFIDRLHNDGLKVHVWTVNKETEMQSLIDLGVDGIMTDNASGLIKVMKQNKFI